MFGVMQKALLGFLMLPLAVASVDDISKRTFEQTGVFQSGKEGYHSFRIPALIGSPNGTLLAFAEGRKVSRSDGSPTALVLKRSFDNGKTWQALQVVADYGRDAFMNPCPVVDRQTGEVILLYNHYPPDRNKHTIVAGWTGFTCTTWMTRSKDNGATWSEPVDITRMVKKRSWTRTATGPGVGIQTRSGRLVIPSTNRSPDGRSWCYVATSSDGGRTWHIGGEVGGRTDECQVVELSGGSLMLNMRSNRGKNRRAVAVSKDGGLTWSEIIDDPQLIEPRCQGSFVRYTDTHDYQRSRVLFANPATTNKRVKMTVRLSYDEGKSWPVAKEIHSGPSAYSCLTVLPDMTIGLIYEGGDKVRYDKLLFARFTLEWLSDGKDQFEPARR